MNKDPCPCCQKNTMKPKADPSDTTLSTTALRGSTTERNDTIRIIKVTELTTANRRGKLPYTALVKAMSPAVEPATSAGPPDNMASRSRNRDTIALPSGKLPSAVGTTVS